MLRTLAPGFRPWAEALVETLRRHGLAPVVTSAYRSYAQQDLLYRRYLAGHSSLPAAPPGRSKHQLGLAVDVDIPTDRRWLSAAGALWRSWGGRWFESDPVHFEAP